MKNKYFKNTSGQNSQVFICPAVAYTTQATIALFTANGVSGEVGIFLCVDTGIDTLVTGALNAGDKFYIAQIIDGQVHRSTRQTYDSTTIREVTYVAPVKQVTNVGYTGTAGTSLNTGTLLTGMIFPLTIIETTPQSQPFPAWPFEDIYKASDSLQAILVRIAKRINDPNSSENKVGGQAATCEIITNGTFTVNTVGSGNVGVTNGSVTVTATGHNVTAGSYVRIGGTTDAFPVYKVAAVATNNFTLDSPYQGVTNAALAIANLGTMTVITDGGFKLTAVNFGEHFRIAIQEALLNATITYTTPFKLGNGAGDQVVELEIEGQTFSGHTTGNAAFDADFGKPTSFALLTGNYDFTFVDTIKVSESVAPPQGQAINYNHIIIAYPTSGTGPKTQIQAYL